MINIVTQMVLQLCYYYYPMKLLLKII